MTVSGDWVLITGLLTLAMAGLVAGDHPWEALAIISVAALLCGLVILKEKGDSK